jgi:ABC-type multidrug transport system fused ATPase/permease subunit
MSRRPTILGGARWRALVCLVALGLGQALAMVAAAFATRDVFMYLRDGGVAPPSLALAGLALSGVALCIFRALEGRVGEAAGQSYAADIRRSLFRHVTRMPVRAITRRRSGALALRYVGDLAAFKGWIARGLARLISASMTIPAALLVLYLLEPRLLLAALPPVAGVLIGIWLLGRPLGAAHADLRRKRARLAASMAERLPQGIQLRRSGRMGTELRALDAQSSAIAAAGVRREWLAASVRALPDAGAGLAGALCLWTCIRLGLGVPDAVACLTALGLVVWPLRHLADVVDRRRAYAVASDKLDQLLAAPRLSTSAAVGKADKAPAIRIEAAELSGVAPIDLVLLSGERRRLAGATGSGKSALLLALAGYDTPPVARAFEVMGHPPSGAVRSGRVLYLGRHAPSLRGTLRRDLTLGIGRSPDDAEIRSALERAGLPDLADRLGGLSGEVTEGRRNITSTEQSRLLLARGLLARPDLALIDADEIGLTRCSLACLIDHFEDTGTSALIVTNDPEAMLRLGPAISLQAPATTHEARSHRLSPSRKEMCRNSGSERTLQAVASSENSRERIDRGMSGKF